MMRAPFSTTIGLLIILGLGHQYQVVNAHRGLITTSNIANHTSTSSIRHRRLCSAQTTCANGACCSQWGFCGYSDAHCGSSTCVSGCPSTIATNPPSPPPTPPPPTPPTTFSPTFPSSNLILNPKFNSNDIFSNWKAKSAGSISIDSTIYHSSPQSAKCYNRSAKNHGIEQSILGRLIPNAKYYLSVWVRLNNAPEGSSSSQLVKLKVKFVDDTGPHWRVISSTFSGSDINNVWRKLEGFVTIQTVGEISVAKIFVDGPDTGIDFYVDDFVMDFVEAVTVEPTSGPSKIPTLSPTSLSPTDAPTNPEITPEPSQGPITNNPSKSPSLSPVTSNPTISDPTVSPSKSPESSSPSKSPSLSPVTSNPTTSDPTVSPSLSPRTSSPSKSPSLSPVTSNPTTFDPTISPSQSPETSSPSKSPSLSPVTSNPTTSDPTVSPSQSPETSSPSKSPSQSPSKSPTNAPVTPAPITSSPTTPSPSASPTTGSSPPPQQGTYVLACGSTSSVCAGQTINRDASELHEVRCCADSNLGVGWCQYSGRGAICENVWGESEINGVCEHGVTYQQALSMCASMGARVCTSEELLADCTRGSGCQHDSDLIWSSTPFLSPVTSNPTTSDPTVSPSQSPETSSPSKSPSQSPSKSYTNAPVTPAPITSSPTTPPPSASPTTGSPTSSPQQGTYVLACGSTSSVCAGQTINRDASELHEVRCCADSNLGVGWRQHSGRGAICENVWGESEINGVCEHGVTHQQALSMCASMGARVCTSEELLADCTRGSGCQHDSDFIWSSTPFVSLAPSPGPTRSPLGPGETSAPTTKPPLPLLKLMGDEGVPPENFPLGICEGDCDNNAECQAGTICFQRAGSEPTPGCSGEENPIMNAEDICIIPCNLAEGYCFLYDKGNNLAPAGTGLYGKCEGDCDTNADCAGNLQCFERDATEPVPGCQNVGTSTWDYCYDINDNTANPTSSPTRTSEPTPTLGPDTFLPGDLTVDCDNGNMMLSTGMGCRKIVSEGTKLFADGYVSAIDMHRNADGAACLPSTKPNNPGGWYYVSNSERGSNNGGVGAIEFNSLGAVIGYEMLLTNVNRNCGGGVTWYGSWVSCEEFGSAGYCHEVSPGPNGIKCSDNQACKAEVVTVGGNYESMAYYKQPTNQYPNLIASADDAWGTFPIGECEGDCDSDADCDGALICFQRTATQDVPGCFGKGISNKDYCTTRSSGNVQPTPGYPDFVPRFYTTEDQFNGPLTRYTPPPEALTTGNIKDILQTPGGTWEYLVLNAPAAPTDPGTFGWSKNRADGEASATAYFKNAEGIDVKDNGHLTFISKAEKRMIQLDLTTETWTMDSTVSGLFAGQPDQVAAWVGADSNLLFFAEDSSNNDIHGRNLTDGRYFTLVQGGNEGGNLPGGAGVGPETTGLAFSPNNMHLYVAFQGVEIYEFFRTDGKPFDGSVIDTKYHT